LLGVIGRDLEIKP